MKIGGYKICGFLGKGGMSRVFKVKVPVIEKIAALKLLSPDPMLRRLMDPRKLEDLFVSEAVTMGSIRHPHIVEVFHFGRANGKPFYVMDYYCNNLGEMIGETYRPDEPSRVISLDKTIYYIKQVLSGLARLHHEGIVHRDIKPYNILITDHDTVKISDFGLSKLRGEKFRGPENLKVGSPWYAAPEQETHPDDVDFSADLYPVGIMLYRMLTGGLPPENVQTPPPASSFNPDLNPEWDRFIQKAMSRERKQRFETAHDMRDQLEKLAGMWEEQKEKTCVIDEPTKMDHKTASSGNTRQTSVRDEAMKVPTNKARAVFGLDKLWRPRKYIENKWIRQGNETVVDQTTGLQWQRSGSAYPLTWREAKNYIRKLNEDQFAGHDDWRLPTINELASLLTPTPHGRDHCLAPIMDRRQKWIWSADRRSFISAWYVSVDLGFVGSHDFTGFYHVKAARTMDR